MEPSIRIGTDSGNGTNTNDDDQSQHNRVFNCGRATFVFQETNDMIGEILHRTFLHKERTNVGNSYD